MKWATTLTVVAAAVGLASGQCSPGFINFGSDQCLYFLTGYGDWYSMLETCQVMGATLAKVTGDLHNDVYQYIVDNKLTDRCFWIGGTDFELEAHWVWLLDGTEIPLGAPHWDPCDIEPDGGYEENYLAICPDMYYFKDYPSSSEHHAICQTTTFNSRRP